jgi:GDP-mannose 6-dehydrogenase
MKVNVFGLGYVGLVSAACLANEGHDTLGIDIDPTKVDMINSGSSPFVERGLEKAIQEAVEQHKLMACASENREYRKADVSLICVGTPSNENGSLNLESIKKVSEQIGSYLRHYSDYHTVNIRSTILPGTTKDIIVPILERYSRKKVGVDFGICMNPEFLREGSSLHDYYHPPFTLIGQYDHKSGEQISQLYSKIKSPLIRTHLKTAEMVKYVSNSFHALKISFANEIGNLCKCFGIDSHEVMDIVCQDRKLNIAPTYLKPGFAFGGSCLPKDLRALLYKGKEFDMQIPLLSSILPSNELQIRSAFELIRKTGKKKIGFLGFSFKAGTDDLRESPTVELIERLLGKGYEICIYDAEVSIAKIYGANKRFIENVIPHVSSLMSASAQEVIKKSDVIVIGTDAAEFRRLVSLDHGKKVIDLVRIIDNPAEAEFYEGICW